MTAKYDKIGRSYGTTRREDLHREAELKNDGRMANVTIRLGNPLDLEALARLNEQVQALHVASRPDQFKAADPTRIVSWLADLLQAASTQVWVAEQDGRVTGFAVVIRREREETPFGPARVWWELDAVGVDAEVRRTGVARALLDKIVSEAKRQGIAELELQSWAFNSPAHAAFRSLGFEPKLLRFELRVSEH